MINNYKCKEGNSNCCNESTNFKIIFISQGEEVSNDFDYIVLDIDLNMNLAMDMSRKYSQNNCKVFGVMGMPKKSTILEAKEAGYLMVLTKSNFAANLYKRKITLYFK